MSSQKNVPLQIPRAVQEANRRQHERFAEKVIGYFDGRNSVKLAVWGLAFKARTDDVRESPAIYCIERFLEKGFVVSAFDPEAGLNGRSLLHDRITTAGNAYDVLPGADALVILTEWMEFRTPDFEQIARSLKKPVVFDGRNLYSPAYVRKQGIEYYSIGRV